MNPAREPFWTAKKYLEPAWAEDAAAVGEPSHEGMLSAMKRLGLLDYLTVADWDAGDAQYKLLLGDFVTCSSYPGNSWICRLNEEGRRIWKIVRSGGCGKIESGGEAVAGSNEFARIARRVLISPTRNPRGEGFFLRLRQTG